jgi:hypothetical protein
MIGLIIRRNMGLELRDMPQEMKSRSGPSEIEAHCNAIMLI